MNRIDMDHRDTIERMFPTEHECGIIPSVFATVERTEWAHRRESITAELLAIAEDAIAEECFAPADDDQPLGITARTDGGYLAVLIHDGERVCTLVGCDLDSISERICDFDLPSDKVAVPIDRADLDAFTRAVLGAVHSLDREIERMERGLAILCGPHRDIRLADAETARANLNRLVTILCNANKGGAK